MKAPAPLVYVVDDDPAVRESLCRLFESVGLRARAFPSVGAFLEGRRRGARGCLVLDVRLPGASGMELLGRMEELDLRLPVIVLTGHGDVPMAVQAMKRGAFDFIEKPAHPQRLLDTVQRALQGGTGAALPPSARDAAGAVGALSARERQVVGRIAHGMTNKAIAAELEIGVRTVETHRAHAMRKLGVSSATELVRLLLGADLPRARD